MSEVIESDAERVCRLVWAIVNVHPIHAVFPALTSILELMIETAPVRRRAELHACMRDNVGRLVKALDNKDA